MSAPHRPAGDAEAAHARRVIAEAFPFLDAVFAPPDDDAAFCFRLRDRTCAGRFRSGVVRLALDGLAALTPADVRALVDATSGQTPLLQP